MTPDKPLGHDPLPMLLWCPACGIRHVDAGEFATKPHHTHACQSCGVVWRPAIEATVGVAFLPGFKNEEPKKADHEAPAGMIEHPFRSLGEARSDNETGREWLICADCGRVAEAHAKEAQAPKCARRLCAIPEVLDEKNDFFIDGKRYHARCAALVGLEAQDARVKAEGELAKAQERADTFSAALDMSKQAFTHSQAFIESLREASNCPPHFPILDHITALVAERDAAVRLAAYRQETINGMELLGAEVIAENSALKARADLDHRVQCSVCGMPKCHCWRPPEAEKPQPAPVPAPEVESALEPVEDIARACVYGPHPMTSTVAALNKERARADAFVGMLRRAEEAGAEMLRRYHAEHERADAERLKGFEACREDAARAIEGTRLAPVLVAAIRALVDAKAGK